MASQQGGINQQKGLVVLVGCRGTPVEAAGDYLLAIKYCELVMEFVPTGQPWCAYPLQGLAPDPVARLQPAAAVGQSYAHQIQDFTEGAIGEAGVREQPDGYAAGVQLGQLIGEILGRKDKQVHVQS